MRVTAKVDYAVRAMIELAAVDEGPVKLDQLKNAQAIPPKFLGHILTDLRRAGLVFSQRGAEGGYRLAREPGEITVADIIRAVEGPLANVQGVRPDEVNYQGLAQPLREVWVATRGALRSVLENVTLSDLVAGELPISVKTLLEEPDAWAPR